MSAWVPGRRLVHALNPEWGVGRVRAVEEGGRYVRVAFPGLDGTVRMATGTADLRPFAFPAGSRAQLGEAEVTVRTRAGESAGLVVYALEGGDLATEDLLEPLSAGSSWLERLVARDVDDLYDFETRRSGLALDCARRVSGLGAVLGARVMLLPHQLHVVRRVTDAERVRLLLADEVGLGKTIEALMIFAALHAEGRADRVLVVTPAALTVQWLGEIWRKFHRVFVWVDRDRIDDAAVENPGLNPFVVFPHAVVSMDWLEEDEAALAQAVAPESAWDLVIIDEAHHLRRGRGDRGNPAFQAVARLAARTRSMLLLTATPLQLDPYEHFALLQLLDPDLFPDWTRFQGQVQEVGAANRLVQAAEEALTAGDAAALAGVAAEVESVFAGHPELPGLARRLPEAPGDALPALARALTDLHPFGDVVVSSRRADVGGFPARVPVPVPVPWPRERRDLEEGVRALRDVVGSGSPNEELLVDWLRRSSSHPSALLPEIEEARDRARGEALRRALDDLMVTARRASVTDPKLRWLVRFVADARKRDKDRKVLVFTEFPETLEVIKARLEAEAHVRVAVFHADLPERERDLEVARFRAVDGGVPVMVCTEAGAEGRNFQFCADLVNFDLPFNPNRIEQRIGRLDRIGQREPAIRIHWFEPEGGIEGRVARLMAATEVFQRPVGGLDPVLEAVAEEIPEVALWTGAGEPAPWEALEGDLLSRLGAARGDLQRGLDRLLHKAAFDPEEAAVLRARYPRSLEDGIAEWVVEAAEQIGVTMEEKAGPATWFVELGSYQRVESLPGLIHGQRWLGTFDREEALQREEIEFFASGHPLVEGLFGLVRDAPYGRVALRRFKEPGARPVAGIEAEFLLEAPGGPWNPLAVWLPARLLRVTVDLAGRLRGDLDPLLCAEPSRAWTMDADEIPDEPEWEEQVRAAVLVAEAEARRRTEALVAEAVSALRAHGSARLARSRVAAEFRSSSLPRGSAERAAIEARVRALSERLAESERVLVAAQPQLHALSWFEVLPASRRVG